MKTKTALITGISGMDGSHMADLLLQKGYKIYGLDRPKATTNYENIYHIIDKITLIPGDLTDQSSLIKALDAAEPDEVYNFAAQSFVGDSWRLSKLTASTNAIGVLNLLEAVKKVNKDIKIQQASTSEMFGGAYTSLANELTELQPVSPYATAKVFAHLTMRNFRDSYNMFTCCSICFNHEGERRGIRFVTRKISDGIAKISLGKLDKIQLGNLDACRDWGYAPDYVEGIYKMMQYNSPEDFVFATGKTHSIGDFLKEGFAIIGVTDWEKYVEQNPSFVRPHDIAKHSGNYDKARRLLNWEPKTEFKELVRIMVKSDIERSTSGRTI